jgi:hypothetical protein
MVEIDVEYKTKMEKNIDQIITRSWKPSIKDDPHAKNS